MHINVNVCLENANTVKAATHRHGHGWGGGGPGYMNSVGCRGDAEWTQETEENVCRDGTLASNMCCFKLKELLCVEERRASMNQQQLVASFLYSSGCY